MFRLFSRGTAPDPPDDPAATAESLDDRALVARCIQRDNEAFTLLYERHLTRIYRYIAYRTLRQDVAEDLTSEVFLNAWRTIDRYQDRGHTVRAWLLRLAHNEVIDYYRRRRDEISLPEQEQLLPLLDGPELRAELSAERTALTRALRQLPDEWQQLILLRFVEELSFEEIGTILGKRSGACRQIQHRALARLREILAAEEVHQ